jgi:hypothetical protein
MRKDEETEKLISIFVASIETAEKNRNSHSRFDIGFMQTNEIKLRSGAISFFDVRLSMFDVRVSYNKPAWYKCSV